MFQPDDILVPLLCVGQSELSTVANCIYPGCLDLSTVPIFISHHGATFLFLTSALILKRLTLSTNREQALAGACMAFTPKPNRVGCYITSVTHWKRSPRKPLTKKKHRLSCPAKCRIPSAPFNNSTPCFESVLPGRDHSPKARKMTSVEERKKLKVLRFCFLGSFQQRCDAWVPSHHSATVNTHSRRRRH